MIESAGACDRVEQLLGEIDTEIVGLQYHEAGLRPGEAIALEREPGNIHDRCAIRVENGLFEPVGYLPREVGHWLAPLLDAGAIRVDGYVAKQFACHDEGPRTSAPAVLTVFLAPGVPYLFERTVPRDKLEIIHEVVRKAYLEAQQFHNTRMIAEMAEGLQPLRRQELLPETRLLLALLPGLHREITAVEGMQALVNLRKAIGKVRIGAPAEFQGLSLFPLFWDDAAKEPYVLLSQAIAAGTAVVEETCESGCVPELHVKNDGELPILIPEGEILIGAKQNRVVNVTVLAAAKSTLNLPVSCVEQGRWHYKSKTFEAGYAAPPTLRALKMQAVQRNRSLRGRATSDQGEIWREVNRCLFDLKTQSSTESLTDGIDAARDRLEEYRKNLNVPEGASGAILAAGGRIVAADLFAAPESFRELWDRYSRAYFFDALRRKPASRKASAESARMFLEHAATCATAHAASIGLGDELAIQNGKIVGGALLYEGRICHLSAFATSSRSDE